MKKMYKLTTTLYVMLLMMLFITKPAYAYLDPGTGSFVIQVLVAFVVGIGAFVKIYWKKIAAAFHKNKD